VKNNKVISKHFAEIFPLELLTCAKTKRCSVKSGKRVENVRGNVPEWMNDYIATAMSSCANSSSMKSTSRSCSTVLVRVRSFEQIWQVAKHSKYANPSRSRATEIEEWNLSSFDQNHLNINTKRLKVSYQQ